MIGIKLDGDPDFLELKPGTAVSLKLENPILGDGEKISPGSYTYPFPIPAGEVSPTNAAKLDHVDVIENSKPFVKKKATIYFNGVPYRSGTLHVNSGPSPDEASTNFIFGMSQIRDDFKTAELRDVMNDPVVIDDTPITKKIYLKRRDSSDYDVTINGKGYKGSAATITSLINAAAGASLDTGVHVPYAVQHGAGNSPLNQFAAPFIEIKLVKYNTVGGVPTYSDSDDPLQELSIKPNDEPEKYYAEAFDMSTYYDGFDSFFDGYLTGAYPDDRFRLPMRLNGQKYKDAAVENTELVNFMNVNTGSGFYRNDPHYGLVQFNYPFTVVNSNSIQPFTLLKYVLDTIAGHFGFEYEGDFYNDPKVAEILIDNTCGLDEPQNFLGEKKFVFWRRSFNVNELVPNMKVVDFFAALQSRWNLAIYFNETTKKVTLNYLEPIARSQVAEDITSMCSPRKSWEDQRVTGIRLVVPAETKDLTSVEESVTVGTPEKDIPVKCGRLHQMRHRYFGLVGRSLVRVEMPFKEDFSLRVFHYRGIVSTSGAPNHPWAHIHGTGNDTYDIQRIFNDKWDYWIWFMLNRRAIKVDAILPFRWIRSIDWAKKVRFNRTNYLIKSIGVSLRDDAVSISEVELYTMR